MIMFIMLFIAMFFVSSLFINGWYSITRGRWEVQPDSSKKWTGMIFNRFHYWLQRHVISMVPYENDEWLKVYWQLRTCFEAKNIVGLDKNYMLVKKMDEKGVANFFAFALTKGFNVKITTPETDNREQNMMISAYKEVKVYKLKEWVRFPLGECPICMSSIYGTLSFWFWYLLVVNVNSIHATTAGDIFINIAWGFKIGLWVLFCILLAFVNEIIFNLNYKLKDDESKKR